MLRYGKLRIVIWSVASEKCPNNETRDVEIPTTASDTLIKLLSAKNQEKQTRRMSYLWNDCLKSALNFMSSSVIDPNCFSVISASVGAIGLLWVGRETLMRVQ